MANPGSQKYEDIPLKIVGSTVFGRYPKISVEQTFNMIISDGWLVPFAGYAARAIINQNGVGRGIYSSVNLNRLFVVIDDELLMFDKSLNQIFVGNLLTYLGDVYISENNAGVIMISDNHNLYFYNAVTPTTPAITVWTAEELGFTPGNITFQNTRFISPNTATSLWRLSTFNYNPYPDPAVVPFPVGSQYEGALQTKADKVVATVRFPGRGNLLLVLGGTVTELWNDAGLPLFPYTRNQSINFDYGCLNASTIAESENIVCWLAINEKSGPTIVYTNGGDLQHISTDGIDYQLANLKYPASSYGFMFKQDGHLFYVITFTQDNISYAYDFNTSKFFTLTDEHLEAFIVKRVAFFDEKYYFVSIRDGNLYELNSNLYTYDYGNGNIAEIPRIRITPAIDFPDQSRFAIGYTGFTIEQGQFPYNIKDTRFNLNTQNFNQILTQDNQFILSGGELDDNKAPKINLSLSKDGGVSFGTKWAKFLNSYGNRANRLMWYQLGAANTVVQQYEFYGFGRFVAKDGITGVY